MSNTKVITLSNSAEALEISARPIAFSTMEKSEDTQFVVKYNNQHFLANKVVSETSVCLKAEYFNDTTFAFMKHQNKDMYKIYKITKLKGDK